MRMHNSEIEVLWMLQSAIRQTASTLRIVAVTWKSGEELLEEIAAHDSETSNLLHTFLNAYLDWFRFHKRLEQQGTHGHLDREQAEELARLVGDRNRTREDI